MEFNQLDAELNLFKEELEFIQLVDQLLDNCKVWTKKEFQKLNFEINKLVSPYMLQPNLLDVSLKVQVPKLTFALQNLVLNTSSNEKLFSICKVLDSLIKVRGLNTIIQFFSYEPKLLVFVLRCYLSLFSKEALAVEFESEFVLLSWLGEFTKIPFDLNQLVLDQKFYLQFQNYKHMSLVEVLVEVGRKRLNKSSKVKFAAGKLLAKLLTRKEILRIHLHPYLTWCNTHLASSNDVYFLEGLTTSLIQMLKLGARNDLLQYLSQFEISLNYVIANEKVDKLNNLRKLKLKLAQRIASLTLKPKLAKWRYLRGSRNLSHHIQPNNETQNSTQIETDQVEEAEAEEEADEQILPIVEFSLQLQFQGLLDLDQSNRILASKSIARLCHRLPKYLVTDINDYLIQQLQSEPITTSDHQPNLWVNTNLWHGTLLTLAQLASRGLILKEKLPIILHLVLDGLSLDLKNNSSFKGSNVRDAACFVLWSFARAYPSTTFTTSVPRLSTALVVTSLFDREINVRRAASATFQEFVGRLAIFPDGIAVLNLTDYFRIGNINYGFKEAATAVATYDAYKMQLFHCLVRVKVVHPDDNLRYLACSTLGQLALHNEFKVEQGVEAYNYLVTELHSAKLAHLWSGGLLAISSLISSLVLKNNSNSSANARLWQPTDSIVINCPLTYDSISQVLLNMDRFNWTSIHSKLIRHAFNQAWLKLLPVHWPLTTFQLEQLLEKLQSNLQFKDGSIREDAGRCIGWLTTYQAIDLNPFLVGFDKQDGRLSLNHLIGLKYAQLDNSLVEKVVEISIAKVKSQYPNFTDSLTLESIVYAIQNIFSRSTCIIAPPRFHELIASLLTCLQSYQISSQGDIGSYLRKAAAQALTSIFTKPVYFERVPLNQVDQLVGSLLKFSVERIDSLADVALTCLHKLLHFQPIGRNYQAVEALQPFLLNTFAKRKLATHHVIRCLDETKLNRYVWTGLVYNFGARSKSEVEGVTELLTDYLAQLDVPTRVAVLQPLLHLIGGDEDKLKVPLIETFLILLESTLLSDLDGLQFKTDMTRKLMQLIVTLRKSKDVNQLTLVTKLACYLLDELNSELNLKLWQHILTTIYHPYPTVRWNTASNLTFVLQSFLQLETFGEAKKNKMVELLETTNWNSDRIQLKTTVKELYQLVGMDIPTKLQ